MNINTGGIMKKLEQHADLITFAIAGKHRLGDFGSVANHYISLDFLQNLRWSLRNPKFFLWDSDHMYTGLFKGGVYAYILAELGIVPAKYKKLIEKVLLGSGVAAMTLPGSGEIPFEGETPKMQRRGGKNPFERS